MTASITRKLTISRWETHSAEQGAGWSNEEHTLTAIAIDRNWNMAVRALVVTVNNSGEPGPVPNAPDDLDIEAPTLHYSFLDFLAQLMPGLPYSVDTEPLFRRARIYAPVGQIGTRGTPCGSDSVIKCTLWWHPGPEPPVASGYLVYCDGAVICDLPADMRTPWQHPDDPYKVWQDGSPSLWPGKPVAYAVSAYNLTGEGPKMPALSVMPLAPLPKVDLLLPDDGSETSRVPACSWNRVAEAQEYWLDVRGMRCPAPRDHVEGDHSRRHD